MEFKSKDCEFFAKGQTVRGHIPRIPAWGLASVGVMTLAGILVDSVAAQPPVPNVRKAANVRKIDDMEAVSDVGDDFEALTPGQILMAQQQPPSVPPLPSVPAPRPTTPPSTARPSPAPSPTPRNLGATAATIGGARGAQSYSPYMIGDYFGGSCSTITIPPLVSTGIPIDPMDLPAISLSPAVPIQFLTPGSAMGNPGLAIFTSPNNPPNFPPRIFTTTSTVGSINTTFASNPNTPIQVQPSLQFNQDALNFYNSQFPAGTLLPTGQIATGTGTVQFVSSSAVFDSITSDPAGPDLQDGDDNFFLNAVYTYTPDIFALGTSGSTEVCVGSPSSSGGGVLGISKIAENASPLPRDRVFMNYSYFDNVPLVPGGTPVNRFAPGFERTFFDQLFSFEMRFPFAGTIDPTITTDGVINRDTVFGNISAITKALLYSNDEVAISGGVQVTIPTAPDLTVQMPDGTQLIQVRNDSVHVMPFFGGLYTPNERFFALAFLQLDIDANGNRTLVNPMLQGLVPAGKLQDPTFLYASVNAGYWMIRSDYGRLTGFAPTVEVHYNQSLQSTDFITAGNYQIGNFASNISTVNMTVGSYFELYNMTTIALGYTVPLGGGQDQPFDGELRAFITRRFGPQSRASRVN